MCLVRVAKNECNSQVHPSSLVPCALLAGEAGRRCSWKNPWVMGTSSWNSLATLQLFYMNARDVGVWVGVGRQSSWVSAFLYSSESSFKLNSASIWKRWAGFCNVVRWNLPLSFFFPWKNKTKQKKCEKHKRWRRGPGSGHEAGGLCSACLVHVGAAPPHSGFITLQDKHSWRPQGTSTFECGPRCWRTWATHPTEPACELRGLPLFFWFPPRPHGVCAPRLWVQVSWQPFLKSNSLWTRLSGTAGSPLLLLSSTPLTPPSYCKKSFRVLWCSIFCF